MKRHEKLYKLGDLLDAGQVADVLTENSGKQILSNNVAALTSRNGVQYARKVGRVNLYLYDDVKDKIIGSPGRKRSGTMPLSAAEKMRRKRSGEARKNNRRTSAGPGASDLGDQVGEKPGPFFSTYRLV